MDAVAFDLDGTLAVPDRERATILRAALDAADAPPITRAAYRRAHRRHLTATTRVPIFADLLAECDTDVDPELVANEYRAAITQALEPVPGIERLLAGLRASYKVGLLTNGPVRAQQCKLDTLGWWDAFDAVAITGNLPAGKPDPRAFDALLTELDATPSRTVFVGDDPEADVRGARQAGLRAIHVVGPDDDPLPSADASVDRSVLVDQLPSIIDSLSPTRTDPDGSPEHETDEDGVT